MKGSNSDHQVKVKNIVISGLLSLSMVGGSFNLFASGLSGGGIDLPLRNIFDTLANDTVPGPVLCPPKFGKKCPKPGTASVGVGDALDELHGTRKIHQDIRDQGGNPYAKMGDNQSQNADSSASLKTSDCPDGLCNAAAVASVKAAKGENSLEVVMAEVVNELHAINVSLDDQSDAPIVHVPAGNFQGQVRQLKERYAVATAGDEAQKTIKSSPVLSAIEQRYFAEANGYDARVAQEGSRHGLGR